MVVTCTSIEESLLAYNGKQFTITLTGLAEDVDAAGCYVGSIRIYTTWNNFKVGNKYELDLVLRSEYAPVGA